MKFLLFLSLFLFILPHSPGALPHKVILNNHWKARKAAEEVADGTKITSPDFHPEGWLDAIVPGTVVTTLLYNHLLPDPLFGMNNAKIPDVFNTGRDTYTYWFYREFDLPELLPGEQAWLSFRGINYFAEIFLNGKKVNPSTHRGMYLRENYLVTGLVKPGSNKLAVWVAPPDPVGNPNNGQGGDGTIARNVTMQCTAGWDWICSIPDRNTGIWDEVSLEMTGKTDVKDTYIETRVPGVRMPGKKQAPAFIRATATFRNCTNEAVNGIASAMANRQVVTQSLLLQPNEEKTITFREIEVKNPKLWWPNGVGDHPLYPVQVQFADSEGLISDQEMVSIGLRQLGHEFDTRLRSQIFSVNGQKLFIKGGNWIASDAYLRFSPERYEAEVRLHAGMNMNMIRVWGGGLTERPDFYDACDRYGILVWQDLWISGDCNGEWADKAKKESQAVRKGYPDDHSLFLNSVKDQVRMLRNHPSLFLWCGGNETYPPGDILDALQNDIFPTLDPDRLFLDKSTSPKLMSNEKGGTGDGPYGILKPSDMFAKRSFPFNPEIGSVGIPNYDGLIKIIPAEELKVPETPNGTGTWAYHKYHSFHEFPEKYGKVTGIEDFCLKAQIVSYEQYRSLQEAFNYKMWDWYAGMLIWKNQNPWTALRGSFYDYFLDYQGGYFGYKHGAVPLHIQLNLNDSAVCVVNQTVRKIESNTAIVRLYDLHGALLSERKQVFTQEAQSVKLLEKITLPDTKGTLFFLKLQIENDKGRVVDENLYWLSSGSGSYEALNQLDKVKLKLTSGNKSAGVNSLVVSNPSKETAFFIRIKVLDQQNVSVLPVYLNDNYFTLLPDESRTVTLEVPGSGNAVSKPLKATLEGWNIVPTGINL